MSRLTPLALLLLLALALSGCRSMTDLRPTRANAPDAWPPGGRSETYLATRRQLYDAAADATAGLGLLCSEGSYDEGYRLCKRESTAFSWGEVVGVYFADDSPGLSRMYVVSKAVLATNITAKDFTHEVHTAVGRRLDEIKAGTGPTLAAAAKAAPVAPAAPPKAPGSVSIPDGPELKVAVLELVNVAALSTYEVETLTDMVRASALRLPTKRLFVLTRENILELLPPGTDLASCEGACEVETGRSIGAHLVISGSVGRFGEKLQVKMKLHDTTSGRLLGAEIVAAEHIEALGAGIDEASERMLVRHLTQAR